MKRRIQVKKAIVQTSEKKEAHKTEAVSVEERIAILAKQNKEKSLKQGHISEQKKAVEDKEKVVVKAETDAKKDKEVEPKLESVKEEVPEKDLELVNSKTQGTGIIDEDKQDSVSSQPVEIQVEESSSLFVRSIAPVIIGIVVGFLTGLTVIYYYQNNSGSFSFFSFLQKNKEKTTQEVNIQISPTLTEVISTPSPTEVVSQKDLYDITILNGSGKAGEAGRLEKTLKEKGYSVLEIGNADASNYKETEVRAKEEIAESFLTALKKDLALTYTLTEGVDALNRNSESDIIIVIGSLTASENVSTGEKE